MRIWALLVGTDGQLSVMWKFQSSVPSPQRSRRDDQSGYTTVDPAFVASEQTCVLTGEVRAARRHQPHTEPLITHVFKGVDWHRNLRQKQPGLHPKSTRRQRSSSLVALPGAVLNRINSNLKRRGHYWMQINNIGCLFAFTSPTTCGRPIINYT